MSLALVTSPLALLPVSGSRSALHVPASADTTTDLDSARALRSEPTCRRGLADRRGAPGIDEIILIGSITWPDAPASASHTGTWAGRPAPGCVGGQGCRTCPAPRSVEREQADDARSGVAHGYRPRIHSGAGRPRRRRGGVSQAQRCDRTLGTGPNGNARASVRPANPGRYATCNWMVWGAGRFSRPTECLACSAGIVRWCHRVQLGSGHGRTTTDCPATVRDGGLMPASGSKVARGHVHPSNRSLHAMRSHRGRRENEHRADEHHQENEPGDKGPHRAPQNGAGRFRQ